MALIKATNPSLTVNEVRINLRENAFDITKGQHATTGYDIASGYGLIQTNASVSAAAGQDTTPPVISNVVLIV